MRFRVFFFRLLLVLSLVPTSAIAGQEPSPSSPDFATALRLAKSGDTAAALGAFATLAQNGHSAAQINLAVMLARGQGTPQDDRRAAFWAWQAWLLGDSRAVDLALYLRARLPAKAQDALAKALVDDLTARLAQASAQQSPPLFLALGRVETELRGPARPDEAAVFFSVAAALGSDKALALREAVTHGLDPETRLKTQERAAALFAEWCARIGAATDRCRTP